MQYKKIVREIRGLPWMKLNGQELQRLMFISHVYACEFAEALRIALHEYPNDSNLIEMARGELQTNNIIFSDYSEAGDHADFLAHFLRRHKIDGDPSLMEHGETYLDACRRLSGRVRAMSVFSREDELSGIFKEF